MDLGTVLPLWAVIPFAGILLSIALFPLINPHFWHKHYPKVSLFWALCFGVPFLIAYKGQAMHEIWHIVVADFIPFIILLGGLFTVAGGIVVKGSLRGSPKVNAAIILIGTLIASWVGTTGASMIMIRPLLKANQWRRHQIHLVIFFIFLVSNIGGALTPLGDPPLFLGFLHGVDFFWTFTHVWEHTLFLVVVLLAIFYGIDTYYYKKENAPPAEEGEKVPVHLEGKINFLLLGGILGAVLMSGMIDLGEIPVGFGIHESIQNILRDSIIVAMGVLSLKLTGKELRADNEFSWGPILEVAYLFSGIFITIIPALAILKAGEHGALAFLVEAVNTPMRYFWGTGILSSFLDNAPTYLTFFNASMGQLYPGMGEAQAVPYLMGHVPEGVTAGTHYLQAISTGAVFMGAVTYIGNAPNFMVKAIAEEGGVPMPSFFGYMLRFSIPFLVVNFIILSLIFF
ncbi:MAG: sodium:proton antiporter [Deltaproteobacteria bacterium]|nr:sodium:proton antiporter [Deltaproteobacteria bacterium]